MEHVRQLRLGAIVLGVIGAPLRGADVLGGRCFLGARYPCHERPFVGVSEAYSWSYWLVFVGDYRQKLTNLLEIDF